MKWRGPQFQTSALWTVDRIVTHQVAMVVIAHKDRLMRFGFDLFAHLCRRHDCEIVVMNT